MPQGLSFLDNSLLLEGFPGKKLKLQQLAVICEGIQQQVFDVLVVPQKRALHGNHCACNLNCWVLQETLFLTISNVGNREFPSYKGSHPCSGLSSKGGVTKSLMGKS